MQFSVHAPNKITHFKINSSYRRSKIYMNPQLIKFISYRI